MSNGNDAGYEARLEQIEAKLALIEHRLSRNARSQGRSSQRLAKDVAAILRTLTVGANGAYPESLTSRRFQLMSQNEEDGITYALLTEIGAPVRRFIEIGAGTNGGNSGFLASELGFEGMMVDAYDENLAAIRPQIPDGKVKLVSAWVTAENINELVSEHGFATEVDVFSLDIDGNDYWVWKELATCDPRIVIVEYNAIFGPERSVAVPYDPEFSIPIEGPLRKAYYGASLKALTDLGRSKGYRLVAVEPFGVNAFFLRSDLAPEIPACEPKAVFRVNQDRHGRPPDGFDIWKTIEQEERELVDFEDAGRGDG